MQRQRQRKTPNSGLKFGLSGLSDLSGLAGLAGLAGLSGFKSGVSALASLKLAVSGFESVIKCLSGRTNESPSVFYRTSSPSGPLPFFPSLTFTIMQSRATGILTTYCPWATDYS